jgi:hypothetical protein
MKRALVLFVFINLFSVKSNSQTYIKQLLDELGYTARSYLLAANRPGYGVSTYITPKNKVGFGIYTSFSDDLISVPFSFSYGVFKNMEFFTGIDLYTQSYNFAGSKVSGVGDAHLGIKYRFQHSKLFEHAFQTVFKLPTARYSDELGTGYVDFHFGFAQTFSYINFANDLSFQFSLLHRKRFNGTSRRLPVLLQEAIDSIKNVYNYKYEPEISISITPSYSFNENIYIYTGIDLSRNMKLDYNSSDVFFGIGYAFSEYFSLSTGGSVSILNVNGWTISLGADFEY